MQIYFTIDNKNRVHPCCDYSPEIEPESDWIVGTLSDNAYEEHGVPLYKYVSGQVVARTQQEVQADIDAIPVPDPTPEEILRADVDYLLMMIDEG